MAPRLNPFTAAPAPMRSRLDFGKGFLRCGLEPSLMELANMDGRAPRVARGLARNRIRVGFRAVHPINQHEAA